MVFQPKPIVISLRCVKPKQFCYDKIQAKRKQFSTCGVMMCKTLNKIKNGVFVMRLGRTVESGILFWKKHFFFLHRVPLIRFFRIQVLRNRLVLTGVLQIFDSGSHNIVVVLLTDDSATYNNGFVECRAANTHAKFRHLRGDILTTDAIKILTIHNVYHIFFSVILYCCTPYAGRTVPRRNVCRKIWVSHSAGLLVGGIVRGLRINSLKDL